jgi:hypothetical protein
MAHRIEKMTKRSDYPYPEQTVLAYGWWEEADVKLLTGRSGSLDVSFISQHDAVVIVGRERIDPTFHPLLHLVERYFYAESYAKTH